MKYTAEQAQLYKDKELKGLITNKDLLTEITMVNGFYIIQSKMNFKRKYKINEK